jgi:hypothetical protein
MESGYSRVERKLREWLDKNEICYYSLVWTECYGGLISISFFSDYDVNLFLDLVNYKSKFRKTDFIIIPETKIVIVTGGSENEIIRSL